MREKECIRQSFLQMLIEGTGLFEENELTKWDHELSLFLTNKNWTCVVAKTLNLNNNWKDILRLKRQCEKVMQEQDVLGHILLCSNMDIILLISDMKYRHPDMLKEFSKCLSQRMGQSVQLGVGQSYAKLSQLHYSKEEAYEALEWCGNQIQVADIRAVYPDTQSSKTGIRAIRQKILMQFLNGTIENWTTELNELAAYVRANTVIHPDAPYPSSIRRTMIELLVEMLHIASDTGVDVDAVIGYVDPYRKVFELQGTPAIIQWVTEIAGMLLEAMETRKKHLEKTQLEQVKEYIRLHISDMQLNLSSASQFIGMAPSYFSAFYIREAGIGFKEYVTNERVELAKSLLTETNDSINTISEKCGFLSPSYFISVFKKQTGMTPGRYRKQKN